MISSRTFPHPIFLHLCTLSFHIYHCRLHFFSSGCDFFIFSSLSIHITHFFAFLHDFYFSHFPAGENNQIVTIVPSTTNPGEVSYVLIVEQSGDNDKDDTVYDFNEADEGLSYVSNGAKLFWGVKKCTET